MSTRVDKLSFSQLDNQVDSIFQTQLDNALKPLEFRCPSVHKFKPEIKLLMKSYILINHLIPHKSTIGQRVLNLQIINSKTHLPAKNWQIYGYFIFSVIIPYLRDRILYFNHSKLVHQLEDIYKCLSFFNFLLFINHGTYYRLWYWLLSIDLEIEKGKKRLSADYFLMYQNLLMSTASDALTYIIRITNFRRLKALFNFHVSSYFIPAQVRSLSSESYRQISDLKQCAICGDWPINPHQIGCKHVYCYFCIWTDFLSASSSGYKCPQCAHLIDNSSYIRQTLMNRSLEM